MTAAAQNEPAAKADGLLDEPFRQLPLALLWKRCRDVLSQHAEQEPAAGEWARQIDQDVLGPFLEAGLPFRIHILCEVGPAAAVEQDVNFAERLTASTRAIFAADGRLQGPRLDELKAAFQEAFTAACRTAGAASDGRQSPEKELRPIKPPFELAKKCVAAWFKQAEAVLAWQRLDLEIACLPAPAESPPWEPLATRCHEVYERIGSYRGDRAWFARDRKLDALLAATQEVLMRSASAFDALQTGRHLPAVPATRGWRDHVQQIRQRINQIIENHLRSWMPAAIAGLADQLSFANAAHEDVGEATEEEWRQWQRLCDGGNLPLKILAAHHLLGRLNAGKLSDERRDQIGDWCCEALAPLAIDWPDAAALHVRLIEHPSPRGTIVKPLHLALGDAPVQWQVSVGPTASPRLTAWLDLTPPPLADGQNGHAAAQVRRWYQELCQRVLSGEEPIDELSHPLRTLLCTEAGAAWFHQLVELAVDGKTAQAAWYHALRAGGVPCYPRPPVDGSAAAWPLADRADLDTLLALDGVRWESDSRHEKFQTVEVTHYAVAPELARCVLSLGKLASGHPCELSQDILKRMEDLPMSPGDALCQAARRLYHEACHSQLDATHPIDDGAARGLLNAMLDWMRSKTGGSGELGLAGKESFAHGAALDAIRELVGACCKAWRRRIAPNLWQFSRPLSQSDLGKPLDELKNRAIFSPELPGIVLLRRFAVVGADGPGDDVCDYAISAGPAPKNYEAMRGLLNSAPAQSELADEFESFRGAWLDAAERTNLGSRLFSGYWHTRRHWLEDCREDAERFDELLREFLSAELRMTVREPKGTEFREKSWVELESSKEEQRIVAVCRPALFTADGKCRVTARVELD